MKPTSFLKGLLLVSCLATGTAGATAQAPDLLIVEGEEQALYTNPLAGWLKSHPGALPPDEIGSSGNWRGYVATWELVGGKLWLRKVEMEFRVEAPAPGCNDESYCREARNVIATLFPGQDDVIASWYTGTLILPKGKQVNYVHMGYGSTYERYTVVWVRRGDVLRQLDLEAEQFLELRRERFRAYQQTEAYRQQLGESLGTPAEEETAQFLFEFAAEQYLSADPAMAED